MMKAIRILSLATALSLLVLGLALAQGTPSIEWSVGGGGGGPAIGEGGVALNATLGQPVIGPAGDGAVSLGAGYWYGLAVVEYPVYLPVVLRNP